MGNITKMEEAIEILQSATASVNDVASWLTSTFGTDNEIRAQPAAAQEKTKHTLEEVRAILAEKTANGYTAEVRELVHKYGAQKLSGVDPANYDALIGEAEVLGNDKG